MLAWLDDAIKDQADQFGGQYCTAVYGVLERSDCGTVVARRLVVLPFRARRPPAPGVHPRGRAARLVGQPGSVLGLLDDTRVPRDRVDARARRHVLLYTDGVTDVAGPSALDDDGLLAVVADAVRDSPEATVTALYQALEARHARVARRDDTAILALHRPGRAPRPITRVPQIELPALSSSPRRARRFVRDTLESFDGPDRDRSTTPSWSRPSS